MIWSFISYWLIFILIVCAQSIIQSFVINYYKQVLTREDRQNPDHLPLNTGQWVREELDKRGLGKELRVMATDGSAISDAFWPSARLIHLTEKTYYKKDAAYWAIGAHELGHALYWKSSAALGALFAAARAGSLMTTITTSLLLANIIFAEPLLTQAAWWTLCLGLGSSVVVLIDEFLASGKALQLLGKDPRLNDDERRSAKRHLVAAWLTYFASFVGNLLLLLLWGYVTKTIKDAPSAAEGIPLEGFALYGAVFLSLLLLGRGLWVFYRIAKPAPGPSKSLSTLEDLEERFGEEVTEQDPAKRLETLRKMDKDARRSLNSCLGMAASGVWQVAVLAFVYLTWDQEGTLAYKIAAALAFISIWNVFVLLIVAVVLPIAILLAIVWAAFMPSKPSSDNDQDEQEQDHEAEALAKDIERHKKEREAFQKAVDKEMERFADTPSWPVRLRQLTQAAFVPMVLLYIASFL